MSDKRFYHLPIPTFKTVGSGIAKILEYLAYTVGVVIFAPTVLLALVSTGVLKGKPGAVKTVQSAVTLLLILMVPFNLVGLLIGVQYAASPHVIVTAVEETDYRYTMEITERKSDFVKSLNNAFTDLIGAPNYINNDVKRTFMYDARTDTWWRIYGIHADRIELQDSWFWETHKWSCNRLKGYMEDYQKDEEWLRNEYLTEVREEIERPLREKQAQEQEKREAEWQAELNDLLEPQTPPESEPEESQDEESDF